MWRYSADDLDDPELDFPPGNPTLELPCCVGLAEINGGAGVGHEIVEATWPIWNRAVGQWAPMQSIRGINIAEFAPEGAQGTYLTLVSTHGVMRPIELVDEDTEEAHCDLAMGLTVLSEGSRSVRQGVIETDGTSARLWITRQGWSPPGTTPTPSRPQQIVAFDLSTAVSGAQARPTRLHTFDPVAGTCSDLQAPPRWGPLVHADDFDGVDGDPLPTHDVAWIDALGSVADHQVQSGRTIATDTTPTDRPIHTIDLGTGQQHWSISAEDLGVNHRIVVRYVHADLYLYAQLEPGNDQARLLRHDSTYNWTLAMVPIPGLTAGEDRSITLITDGDEITLAISDDQDPSTIAAALSHDLTPADQAGFSTATQVGIWSIADGTAYDDAEARRLP